MDGLIILVVTTTAVLWNIHKEKPRGPECKDAGMHYLIVGLLIVFVAFFVGIAVNGSPLETLLLKEKRYGINLALGVGYGLLSTSITCLIIYLLSIKAKKLK